MKQVSIVSTKGYESETSRAQSTKENVAQKLPQSISQVTYGGELIETKNVIENKFALK